MHASSLVIVSPCITIAVEQEDQRTWLSAQFPLLHHQRRKLRLDPDYPLQHRRPLIEHIPAHHLRVSCQETQRLRDYLRRLAMIEKALQPVIKNLPGKSTCGTELGDKSSETFCIPGILWIEFLQCALKPERRQDSWSSMAWTNDK